MQDENNPQHFYRYPSPYQSAQLAAKYAWNNPSVENTKNAAFDIATDLKRVIMREYGSCSRIAKDVVGSAANRARFFSGLEASTVAHNAESVVSTATNVVKAASMHFW